VDEFPKGIVDTEEVILYPYIAAEHLGVVIGQDQPLPLIEEELVPQGQAKDAAARNANIQPFYVAGVVAAPIVHANADELNDYKIDDDDGTIVVGDTPQQPPHAPLVVVNDTDNNDDAAGSGDDDNDDDNDNDGVDVGKDEMTRRTRMTTMNWYLQPMRRRARNLTATKECEDRDAEERAPEKSTPTTVC